MREYRFQATDSTVEALRKLRSAWSRIVIGDMQCTVTLAGGDSVVVEVDTVDVEGVFDAYRLSARLMQDGTTPVASHSTQHVGADGNGAGGRSATDFNDGGNDVVLFSGASWSEPAGTALAKGLSDSAILLFSGHVGQVTETAEIVCVTTDAFVVASPSGKGMLFRTGLKPESIEVITDADKVREFLVQRGYTASGE